MMSVSPASTVAGLPMHETGSHVEPDGVLDLAGLPKFFLLPTHLTSVGQKQVEGQLKAAHANTTHDISEAQLVLTSINRVRRVKFELQVLKLDIKEIILGTSDSSLAFERNSPRLGSLGKRKRGSEKQDADDWLSSPKSNPEDYKALANLSIRPEPMDHGEWSAIKDLIDRPGCMKVIKLDWLLECTREQELCSMVSYTICDVMTRTRTTDSDLGLDSSHNIPQASQRVDSRLPEGGDLEFPDLQEIPNTPPPSSPREESLSQMPRRSNLGVRNKPSLLHETTVEHERRSNHKLPEMPKWVKERKIYACERVTLPEPPNDHFIALLKRIRLGRELTEDEIGVRAYSSSIASIAAYPYLLSDEREVLALPQCDEKIATLWREFNDTGTLSVVEDFNRNPEMIAIEEFYKIYGVGAKTAREFYHDRGWRTRDDIIEKGWNDLNREQQIGLKFFDEFQMKIPRSEVEFIASVVTYHAKQVVDDGIVCTIVGGYRRGKRESGDVDLILSHPRDGATSFIITPIVEALTKAGWITHTLKVTETHSEREEHTLDLRPRGIRGSGFDTLDKALVAWQDPTWPTRDADLAADPDAKNPAPHRRVDIIISPWRTVGCAITGWTSGTTFQRDMRRYARKAKGWKFDSSGVRDRATWRFIDLEKWENKETRAKTWQEAEKRVFEGLELPWLEPWERCTG